MKRLLNVKFLWCRKDLKKAAAFIGKELPKELFDFYSQCMGVAMYWKEKNKFKYPEYSTIAELHSLSGLFFNYKPEAKAIPFGTDYDDFSKYIKKSDPFYLLFPIEPSDKSDTNFLLKPLPHGLMILKRIQNGKELKR